MIAYIRYGVLAFLCSASALTASHAADVVFGDWHGTDVFQGGRDPSRAFIYTLGSAEPRELFSFACDHPHTGALTLLDSVRLAEPATRQRCLDDGRCLNTIVASLHVDGRSMGALVLMIREPQDKQGNTSTFHLSDAQFSALKRGGTATIITIVQLPNEVKNGHLVDLAFSLKGLTAAGHWCAAEVRKASERGQAWDQ